MSLPSNPVPGASPSEWRWSGLPRHLRGHGGSLRTGALPTIHHLVAGERPSPGRVVCGGFLQQGTWIFVRGGIEATRPLRQGEVVLGAEGGRGGGTLGCQVERLLGGLRGAFGAGDRGEPG